MVADTDHTIPAAANLQEQAIQLDWRRLLFAASICLFPLILYGIILILAANWSNRTVVECFLLTNFRGGVGIPLAIVTALTIIVLLASGIGGHFKLELWGLKLTGPTLPILLWVVCFLAIVLALYELFPNAPLLPALAHACDVVILSANSVH